MRQFVGVLIAAVSFSVPMLSCTTDAKLKGASAYSDESACVDVNSARSAISTLDGSRVSVCGIFKYEFEDINLYQDLSSSKNYSRNQCLSISIPEGATQDFAALSGKRVRVEAVATADFCPEGTICAASCSDAGLHVSSVTPIR